MSDEPTAAEREADHDGAASGPKPRASCVGADPVRGAPDELLDLPAHELMDRVAWAGATPDPDTLDAASFLAWL